MRKNLYICNIVNASLALLISTSHGISAMESSDDTPFPSKSTMSTDEIRSEVNRVLKNFQDNMNAYYERTRNPKRVSIPLPAEAAEDAEQKPEEQPGLEETKEEEKKPAISQKEIVHKIQQARAEGVGENFISSLTARYNKKELDPQAMVKSLDEAIMIRVKVFKEGEFVDNSDPENLVWLRKQYESGAMNYQDALNRINAKIGSGKLAKDIKAKKSQAERLGLPYATIDKQAKNLDPEELRKWLDQKIEIRNAVKKASPVKFEQAVKSGVDFDTLSDREGIPSKEKIIAWLKEQMPLQEKIDEAKRLGVAAEGANSLVWLEQQLRTERMSHQEGLQWLNERIEIQRKISEATQLGAQPPYGQDFPVWMEQQLRTGMTHQAALQQLNKKITIQEKINKAKKFGITNIDFKKRNLNDEKFEQWLDEEIANETPIQERITNAKQLGVPQSSINDKRRALTGDQFKQWLEQRITLYETANKAIRVLGITWNDIARQKSILHNNEEDLLKWLNEQITTKEKANG